MNAIAAHLPIIGAVPPAKVGNAPGNQTAIAGNSQTQPLPDLPAAVSLALARIGMSDKEAAGVMDMSPAQWSRQKNGVDGHHIQLDRLALLPENFHREFARIYGSMVGLEMAHQTIADLLVARVGQLLIECHALAAQMRRTA